MSFNYYWDEDRGVETDWRQHCRADLARVLNNVHYGKYEDVFDHIKEWRDHPSNVWIEDGGYYLHYDADMTDDECYSMALFYLQGVLEDRVQILKKVANLYRKNSLEDMTAEDRWRFVRPKLKWKPFVSEFTYRHLVEYPPHLLHVQRFRR